MRPLHCLPFFFLAAFAFSPLQANDKPSFNAAQWAALERGQPVLMDQNPCLRAAQGKNYVTAAMLVKNSVENVWSVVSDAEAAPSYVDDMVLAKVVAAKEGSILVEHGMKVNFREYKYWVRQFPTPNQKVIFRLEKGSFRSMDGGWWLYPVKGGRTLLVYSLHFDPGGFCPKKVVQSSLMKKIPETLVSINRVIQRRSGFAAASTVRR